MSVFADTSGLYAIVDPSDASHQRARLTWASLLGGDEPLVTTNYVLIELLALLQRRIGLPAVRHVVDEILPALDLVWVDAALHERATHALLAANRRDLSLVDCVSFAAMARDRIGTAFAIDPHVEEQGFALALRAVPPERGCVPRASSSGRPASPARA